MEKTTAPRIYCIPATRAPVVAVLRRGPTSWSHVGRWNLAAGTYEPGAWLRGRLFPRRSDLSPDGRFLCYFSHQPGASWDQGDAYVALSRLPWLTALHAFGTCGTWTRGYWFSEDGTCDDPNDEDLPMPYGLRSIPVVQFASERRRGWKESPDCPPRDPEDMWDVRRNARMEKDQPGGHRKLCVESLGVAGGEFGVDQAVGGLRVSYSMESDGQRAILDDVQWADWDQRGRLLIATRDGRLQIRELRAELTVPVFEADLSTLRPNPLPPPDWAQSW